jgi:hypothetical protein
MSSGLNFPLTNTLVGSVLGSCVTGNTQFIYCLFASRESIVSIANRLGARCPRNCGLVLGTGNIYFFCSPKTPKLDLEPTQSPMLLVSGAISSWVKRPEREVAKLTTHSHLLLRSRSYTFTLPYLPCRAQQQGYFHTFIC